MILWLWNLETDELLSLYGERNRRLLRPDGSAPPGFSLVCAPDLKRAERERDRAKAAAAAA